MVSLGQELKKPKFMRKTILQERQSCSVQKIALANTKYWRNETILNIGHLVKAIAPCKMISLGQKLKMPKTCEKPFYKNVRVVQKIKNTNNKKTFCKTVRVILCKKTVRRNTKYSRNETTLKIRHLAKAIAHAKAIAFAKCSIWVKN